MKTGGQCYAIHGRAIDGIEFENAVVVHGIATLIRGEHQGKQFGHCWIEFKTELGIIVKDLTADILCPKDVYYRLGKVDETRIFKYTAEETWSNGVESGHWGPWEDGINPEEEWLKEISEEQNKRI